VAEKGIAMVIRELHASPNVNGRGARPSTSVNPYRFARSAPTSRFALDAREQTADAVVVGNRE
jgi:hypothetical protein